MKIFGSILPNCLSVMTLRHGSSRRRKRSKRRRNNSGSKPNLLLPHWKTTTQVIQPGKISLPLLPLSRWNSTAFKRPLWIPWMALRRTIREHDWLIMYGRCGEHSHSCMPHSKWTSLYSSYESVAAFKTDFWGRVTEVPSANTHPQRSCWWHVIQYSSRVQLCVPMYRCMVRVESRCNIVKQRSNLFEASTLPCNLPNICETRLVADVSTMFHEKQWKNVINIVNKQRPD